jgi:hypothetical protein
MNSGYLKGEITLSGFYIHDYCHLTAFEKELKILDTGVICAS